MALEQITGGSTDARTDQFAFCVVLHEALYGERPFEGDSLIAISKQIASERVREAPGSAGVPAWLRRVVLRGLRAAPHDRYPSMDSLLADLTRDRGALLRRIVAAVAVVALMGATALVALRALGHKSAVCRGAEAQLDGVWDGARRRHVLAAFARTGKPFAAKAYAEVVAYLDKHARDWVAMRTDACEATRVRGEQSEELLDRRMACLSERLEEMRALADLLSRADTVVVAKSLQAAHALPPVQTCGDLAPLAARVSPPSDSAARARVASLRARLSEAEVLLETGKPEQAAEIARSALDEARPLRYPPLEAVAEYLLGRASAKRGDLPAAEQALAEAVWAATAGRADDVVADAATALVYVVGYELGRPDRGRLWASFAKAALDRLGKDEKREGHLTNNTAALLYAEGRYDEALDTYRRGLGLAEKASGPASLDVSVIATNIGGMHEELAQYDQAVPYFERGLAIREKLLGPEHPEVAQSLRGLGHALAYVGQAQRALSLLERAQATAERALGADHGMVALVLGCLGDALQASGRSDDALARYEQAAAGIERAYGPGSARLVEVLNAAGELERKRGRIDKAITTHTQALERARAGLGAEHLEVAISHYYIGRAHAARGDHRAALQEYGRASAIADKLLRREGPLMGILLVAVGESQLGARNLAGAKATLEQALRVLESNRVDPYEQARARLALSRALRALGEQPERAGKLAAAAKDAFAATGARASNELADAEAWLRAGPDLRAPGHP
jgi:Tfp pilus assembly protein PilF